jgi:RNA polymerase sigma-70 factor (sigma-E family)
MTSVARAVGVEFADDPDAAISALFRLHFWALVRLARQLVDDQQTAEDVVQDAFLTLHRRWTKLRDPDSALTYVRSAVLNLSRSQIRRHQIRRRLDSTVTEGAAPAADARALSGADADRISAALRRLPRRQREVLVLRYWSELDEQEIARTLGVSRGSVKTHVHRAMRALERELGEADDE